MQRLCPVALGIKEYRAAPAAAVTPDSRRCPFCSDRHPLRIHGCYRRFALLPDPDEPHLIPVMRLLCSRTGKTVSLLPEFCTPRRQHGPAILARFLSAWVSGAGLLPALRSVRRDVAGHSVAQSLFRGFRDRIATIKVYLAGIRPCGAGTPPTVPESRRPIADVFFALIADARDAVTAFLHHGVALHNRFHLGIA